MRLEIRITLSLFVFVSWMLLAPTATKHSGRLPAQHLQLQPSWRRQLGHDSDSDDEAKQPTTPKIPKKLLGPLILSPPFEGLPNDHPAGNHSTHNSALSDGALAVRRVSKELELRDHRRIVLGTHGTPLALAGSPKQLGKAILHAMIGHFTLFDTASILHRDVSSGNIMLLKEPDKRKIPNSLEDIVQDGECLGVLIDDDVAKQWDRQTDMSGHRSGTKPFLSWRISMLRQFPKEFKQTPLDDLESFLWVLVYTLLQKTPTEAKTGLEQVIWEQLNSSLLPYVVTGKSIALHSWDISTASGNIKVFGPLIEAWFELALAYNSKLTKLMKDPDWSTASIKDLARVGYRDYIRAGLEHIETLPDQWH